MSRSSTVFFIYYWVTRECERKREEGLRGAPQSSLDFFLLSLVFLLVPTKGGFVTGERVLHC